VQIVQEEGELVWIPPHWWHQVYHLQPSIAIASQLCHETVKDRVFKHILSFCRAQGLRQRPEQTKNPENNRDIDYARMDSLSAVFELERSESLVVGNMNIETNTPQQQVDALLAEAARLLE
jgi:ribosomal protein L16 Arg81 hydroxylase